MEGKHHITPCCVLYLGSFTQYESPVTADKDQKRVVVLSSLKGNFIQTFSRVGVN